MGSRISRRRLLQSAGAAAAMAAAPAGLSASAQPKSGRMPVEGAGTPKICLGGAAATDQAALRRLKQIGVNYVLTGGPRIPWTEADIRGRMDQYKAAGITLCNLMISGFDDVIWGRPGADEQTE